MGNSLSNTALFRPTEPSYGEDLQNLVYIPELLNIDVEKFWGDETFEIFNKEENVKELQKRKFPAIFLYSKTLRTKHTIMYFHSNSCDLGQIYDEMCNLHEHLQANILAIEYIGFGLCYLWGSPNQYNINRRALAAYNFLRSLNIKSEQIILFGRSIGTGVATKLAYNLNMLGNHIGGIILHSPYISIEKLVEEYFTYSSYIIENIYDNYKNLSVLSKGDDSDTPLLLIHGKEDEVIGVSHSEFLMKNLNNKFKTAFYPADSYHNYYYVIDDLGVPSKTFLDTQSKSRHEESVDIIVPKSFFKKELQTHKAVTADAAGMRLETGKNKSERTSSARDKDQKKKEKSIADSEKKKNSVNSLPTKRTNEKDLKKNEKNFKEKCETKNKDIGGTTARRGKDKVGTIEQSFSKNSDKEGESKKEPPKHSQKISLIISSLTDKGLKNLKKKEQKHSEDLKGKSRNGLRSPRRNNLNASAPPSISVPASASASDNASERKERKKIISYSKNKNSDYCKTKEGKHTQETEDRRKAGDEEPYRKEIKKKDIRDSKDASNSTKDIKYNENTLSGWKKYKDERSRREHKPDGQNKYDTVSTNDEDGKREHI
ncbi:alpha/beta hydrolase, putative [Plasmodium knowlesi strain H]|uniref:Alpha/beta hydrolase, putative n=3 Tax=Plasmodium knowlesi TaxID=5850 RepID=A0A5K1UJY3_PLAKH|nr:alpha/beta hydrolase, putative [Plasmodium knowlesi strain H]OTN66389.1 putative Alpha/beta hydrolase [Plasmodium knowlesi]CAA9986399.1 alpha/beta hydrolase, putative [Plasmodium knowlesi strain H]SBO25673.1 alpha/beta hydrolase, putative [Plasmodium knowlesi strain H]SBO28383.1 alpha/beta hydrolase, putative [Plasmodium knowlesi strain H]VVS75873.1 alpha/beta hydrolase, putative [Plasmodium knowlesi strain H]|eukprot:XP_002257805.1 hypothetical protein, conserved in Plasmodium species [Plasmodium knowlesi strain H]